MTTTRDPTPAAWAKLTEEGSLPLADHGTDVAAVMDALLSSGWRSILERAAGRDLTQTEIETLLALTFLHDVGKTNRGFWRRQFEGSAHIGHTSLVLTLASIDAARAECDRLRAFGADPLLATLSHHGRPVLEAPTGSHDWVWAASGDYDPIQGLRDLLDQAQRRHPQAFEDLDPTDLPPRAVSLFAGLLTLADWIGSDQRLFPLDGVTGEDRRLRSDRTAREVVRARGLHDASALIPAVSDCSFAEAFGVETPREAQVRSGEMSLGTLCILETETGSGKTEAAIWRFLKLLAAGEVDGLYFALPTRTSAVQMWGRVKRCLDAVFGPDAVPPVLAVPGYLRAGEAEGVREGAFETLWPDRPQDVGEDARWAAEAPKRYLAARVAVGTVDQVLMAGLRVRHAHLRAASLARSLLVVDEVHASDTYMTGVLRGVLANHREAGGHAMLLSATLGSTACHALMTAGRGAGPSLQAACAVPYPALHGSDAGTTLVRTDGRCKKVALTLLGVIDAPEAIAEHALAAARTGARVLVIRNTVDGAVAVQRALEALAGGVAHLFALGGVQALHHGRFAAEDRRLLDAAIEAAFGKGRDVGTGLVAVGTQTLEMSLDLDADLMITDLAPVDVLLQRLGRLHRHAKRSRPAGFEAAAAFVATPAGRNLSPYLGRVPRRHGLGPSGETGQGVYANLVSIEATLRLLEDLAQRGSPLVVPEDNRRLVEMATHPEVLDAISKELGWEAFTTRFEGRLLSERQLAGCHSLDLGRPFSELDPFPEDEAIRTRLDQDDWRVELEDRPIGPFGAPISALTIPGWMAKGLTLDAPIRATPTAKGIEVTVGERRFDYDRFGLHGS